MVNFVPIDASTEEHFIKQIQQLQQFSFVPSWSENLVIQHLKNSRTKSFALIDENSLIGYVFFQCLFDCAEILQIAIHPDYQQKGFAACLIEKSVSELQQSSIETIQLEVRESNGAAIKLYQSLNFTLDGVRKNYYSPADENSGRESAHLYSKSCVDKHQEVSE